MFEQKGRCPWLCDSVPWCNCPLFLWSSPLTNHPATFHICCMSASARRAHPSRTLPASLHYACCWTGRTVWAITKQRCRPCARLVVPNHHFHIVPKSFEVKFSLWVYWLLHYMNTVISIWSIYNMILNKVQFHILTFYTFTFFPRYVDTGVYQPIQGLRNVFLVIIYYNFY